jgi:N-acetylmuramoyl-L-alanine amidase CwlA
MAILKPDTTTKLGDVTVNEYLLTKHNPNNIDMPSVSMEGKIMGVTIHNTDWISVASGTTPAEQYTRATVNGNMKDVRVHYYVDNTCAWQNLPLTLSGWHAADGSGNGNRRTIAIECIMSSSYNDTDKKSEDNAAKLAAALLKKYNLGIEKLYTHTHWLNVRDGKTGTVDQLNTMKNSYKMCPLYILPHWTNFKEKVQDYLNATTSTMTSTSSGTTSSTAQLYRVRKTWSDAKSQIGAYSSLENAKKACTTGYSVFDNSGSVVYTKSYSKGTKITLNNATLYASATATSGTKKSGTFYIYDGQIVNDRMRVTTKAEYCGATPVGQYVTGWITVNDIK